MPFLGQNILTSLLTGFTEASKKAGSALGGALGSGKIRKYQQEEAQSRLDTQKLLYDQAQKAREAGDISKAKKLAMNASLATGDITERMRQQAEAEKVIGREGVKGFVGNVANVLPGVKGAGTGLKTVLGILRGAGQGYGASKEGSGGIDALIGGLTGGVLEGGGSFVSNKLKGAGEDFASKFAKATPAMYQKALKKGIDINKVVSRITPAGATPETLIGDITQGGKGGVIAKKLLEHEGSIASAIADSGEKIVASADEITRPLLGKLNKLGSVPGNKQKVDALKAFIEETKQLYPEGLNAEGLLNLKRTFDQKFGESVTKDTGGAVLSDAQKSLANTARKILKNTFPQIGKALDAESELYTIRPIIERAASISKTPGSTIRRGSASAINPLNPLTLIDFITSNPRVASTLAKASPATQAVEGAVSKLPQIPQVLKNVLQSGLINSATGDSSPMVPQVQAAQQPEQQTTQDQTAFQSQTPSNDFISQAKSYGVPDDKIQGFLQYAQQSGSPMSTAAQQRQGNEITLDMLSRASVELPEKEYNKLERIYKLQQSSGSKQKALTQAQVSELADFDTSEKLLNNLEQSFLTSGKTGPIKGAISKYSPYDVGGQAINSQAGIAAQVIGKALEGGKLGEGDIKRYRELLPSVNDTPAVAQAKINNVRALLQIQKEVKRGALQSAGYGVSGEELSPEQQAIALLQQQLGIQL